MNTASTVTLLTCSVLILSGLAVSLLLVRQVVTKFLQTLSNLAQRSEAERNLLLSQWTAERNNFLDRLMTKTWEQYAQLSGVRVPSEGAVSPYEEPDHGTGEVLIDLGLDDE